MSKPANVDIHNLFHKFGGNPDNYHEIVRDRAEEKALDWPIIAAMKKELPRAPRLRQPASINMQAHTASPAPRSNAAPATLFGAIQHNLGSEMPATAPRQQETPAPGALRSLFGALEAQSSPTQHTSRTASAGTVDHRPETEGTLAGVFSRLLDTPQPGTENPSRDVLQNIFGRLNK